MIIGYCRVSTNDQTLDSQIDQLKNAGAKKIYQDVVSGTKSERKELSKMLEMLREGDTVLICRLDRLGRSLSDLIKLVVKFDSLGVNLKSLSESIDTSTSTGKLVFHIFGSIAEFERELIRERTKAGLAAARARGRMGGRKKAKSLKQRKIIVEAYKSKKHSVAELCQSFGISKPTLYKYVNEFP